ncbi:MAG TPA: AtpZ/AtpI family protein [Candidatus Microsaccharimonas sp.]|jgi:F0F1-type ATP synthase assembly protein I
MGESPKKMKTKMTTQATTQAVLILATTALDATWRTIVPGVLGTVLGLMADHALHTTPLITITGLVLGMALSAYLIYRLFKGIQK